MADCDGVISDGVPAGRKQLGDWSNWNRAWLPSPPHPSGPGNQEAISRGGHRSSEAQANGRGAPESPGRDQGKRACTLFLAISVADDVCSLSDPHCSTSLWHRKEPFNHFLENLEACCSTTVVCKGKGHQQAHKVDKPKAIAERLREIAENGEKLRP